MRLWSFHPKYLDNVGLSRAINEGISGYKALTKQQKMWQNHSQLTRFKARDDNCEMFYKDYLSYIMEFKYRVNLFQIDKKIALEERYINGYMTVTKGQLVYEWNHYLNKLKKRNPTKYAELRGILIPEPHPIFRVIDGDIESWEKVKE